MDEDPLCLMIDVISWYILYCILFVSVFQALNMLGLDATSVESVT